MDFRKLNVKALKERKVNQRKRFGPLRMHLSESEKVPPKTFSWEFYHFHKLILNECESLTNYGILLKERRFFTEKVSN